MLNHNKNHNSSCAFAGQVVDYLYDEANAMVRNEFETHLINCSNCADEIAGFGVVRSSIGVWRKEFSALETPVIEIPYLKLSDFNPNQTVSTVKRSLLADFRSLFSLSPMWKSASAAFAALAVCVGIAFFVFLFSGNKELSINNNLQIEPPVPPTNKIENKVSEKVEVVSLNGLPDTAPNPETANSQPNTSKQNTRNPQENSVVKIANNASKQKTISPKSNKLTVRKETNTNNETNTANTQKRQAPKLSDLSEEEDKKSLRLADLFEDIGTE